MSLYQVFSQGHAPAPHRAPVAERRARPISGYPARTPAVPHQ